MRINKLAAVFTAAVLSALPVMNAAAYGTNAIRPDPELMDFNNNEVNGAVSVFIADGMNAHISITFDSPEGTGIGYYDFQAEEGGQYVFDIEGRDETEDDYRHYSLAVTFKDENGFETPAFTDEFAVPEGEGEWKEAVVYEYSFTEFDTGSPDTFAITGLTYPENDVVVCHKDIAVNYNTLMMGDVDFDEKITAIDASAVLVEYAEITSGNGSFTEEQNKVADVNHDGKITATDATAILRYYTALSAGLDPKWE